MDAPRWIGLAVSFGARAEALVEALRQHGTGFFPVVASGTLAANGTEVAEPMMEVWRWVPCDNCGGTETVKLFTSQNYTIVRCRNCGLMYVNPRPSLEQIVEHYRADTHWGGEPQRCTEAMSRFLYAQVLRLLPASGEVLDIGCSFGIFLEELRRAGYSAVGIELSATAAAVARSRGFQVYEQPLDDLHLETERFTAVTLLNVIEHLNAPFATCRETWRVLKPGGVVVLVTPNTDFALPFVQTYTALTGGTDIGSGFPRRISQLYPPNHLYFYTPSTLENLLIRAGFVSCRVQNALPIVNRNWLKTLAKWLVWGGAEIGCRITRGRWLGGHSLLAWGYKRVELADERA